MTAPRILVVDDNEITRKLVRITLSSEGYTVVEAQDGASAIQALRAEKPNLILQDMILPDTGGIELVERLRNEPLGAVIPILAFSGFQSEMELAEKLRVGFTDFLFKPVEPARLIQVVRAYLPMEPVERLAAAAGARVVLADDDPVQLKLSSLHLQRKGYRVTIAHDGREALEAVQLTEPDAVVSDVLMPGMDGFTLCLSIKQDPRSARVPVVLTTSVYTELADRELATQVGAFDLVQRTPDLGGILEALEAALSNPGGTRATTQDAPTGAYLHRVVRQLERQAEENRGHGRRLFLLEAELALLAALSELLAQDAPLPEILSELLERCLDSAGLSSGVIWRVEDEQPVILAGIGIRLGHQLTAETCAALAENLGSGEQPRLIKPASAGREPERLALEQLEARSILVTPLRIDEQPVGGLLLASAREELGGDWPVFARTIANHVSNAMAQARHREATRRALEERDQAEGQLRQASKMEAIGNLAGGVAHDFNNLLTAIIGFGEMALDEDTDRETVRGHVQEMVKAGERAAALTRQLLAFSRRQVLRPEVINLNGVVENMDRLLQRVIGEHIDLKTRLQDDLSYARADPGQIEQVILNLAVNARDAMAAGGQLTIETRNCNLDQTYASEHAEVSAGPYVLLSVTDTGSGIPPEVLARIFEPFFTTKEQGKGTGLGLATVYGIVKQSGGHLSVYSEVGIGTTFKVYLPKVEAPEEVQAPAPVDLPERATKGATILLVEDELGVRALARAVLGSAGYSVMEASSPDEALQLIERLNRPVELMVTDVVMPGMNGPALAARVHERWPGMKVIFMSGYPGDPLRRQGTIGEDAPYLEKPFTPKALRAKVQEVLESDS